MGSRILIECNQTDFQSMFKNPCLRQMEESQRRYRRIAHINTPVGQYQSDTSGLDDWESEPDMGLRKAWMWEVNNWKTSSWKDGGPG